MVHDDIPPGERPEPRFVPGQSGRRLFSVDALVERLEAAFVEEYGLDSPALREADTTAKRLKLLLETAEYLFAVESVQLSVEERADIVSRTYSSLFAYGPLDALFLDDRVTTITLDGAEKAAVRYGHGELVSLGRLFQDEAHFRRTLQRLLVDAGAELREDQPYVEAGLLVGERPVCLNLVGPPAALQFSADLRVHPKVPPTPESLVEGGFFNPIAAELLRALVASPHGLIIVGEAESGKTTLLSTLAGWLPERDRALAVERAGELRLPPDIQRLVVQWPLGERSGISFGARISQALEQRPACLLLDEVRADEPETIAPLLTLPDAPRQVWSFRGPIFDKRLSSALGMLARRADTYRGEELVRALYERLPFVITLNRLNDSLSLWSVGEWQFKHSPDYPTYTPLLRWEGGGLRLTGERPALPLPLPDSFWN